jgi:hypothetical protein
MERSKQNESKNVEFNRLDSSGDGLKQWKVDVINHITVKFSSDVANFMRNKTLPIDHTQSKLERHRMDIGGQLIVNQMPGMAGTFEDRLVVTDSLKLKKLTTKEIKELVAAGALVLSDGNYHSWIKVPIAANYNALYPDDPYTHTRVRVDPKMVKELS